MASPSRTLKLTYLGDASQLKKENASLDGNFSKLGDSVKKFGIAAGAAFAAAGAAGIVVGKKLFDAAEQAGTANARIEQITTSMGNFGERASEVAGDVADSANQLAKLTGVERNAIKETQALLLTFNSVNKTADETNGVFDRATKAALDLAAAGFGSATGNAQQLGKALEDPIKGLSSLTRSGVTFTDAERERIKVLVESNQEGEAQAIILEAIEKQVSGTAEATSNASDRIRQSFGVIVDQIALSLVPIFEKLTDAVAALIDRFAEWWKDNGPKVIDIIQRTVERAVEFWNIIRTALEPIVRRLIDTFVDLLGRFRDWWKKVAPAVFDAFERIKDGIIRVWDSLKPLIQSVKDIFAAMFGGVKEGGEGKLFESFLGVLVGLIEAVAAALSFAFEQFDRLFGLIRRIAESKIVQGLLSGIGSAVSTIGSFFGSGGGKAAEQAVARPALSQAQLDAQTAANVINRAQTNITVNGAIDPESTARQIQRVLNDSQRRTGAAVFVP